MSEGATLISNPFAFGSRVFSKVAAGSIPKKLSCYREVKVPRTVVRTFDEGVLRLEEIGICRQIVI
jgi:hypothetical protein